ncbi:MAG: DNA gyrase subunit A [Methylococcales bacterium]|jgi:DNA gyrase subunit A|nr:DNA gyrase subunit A [Methylococcales bacterium]
MSEFAKEIIPVNLEDEMKDSYLSYAMSVIIGRALPDVRDGLKPVHRRVLYAMHVLRNDWNKPYKKSARVVGDVIGKYHPHGDTAVYDTIVRMAQPFSMRYMIVDGQGNFGSVDGDSPAAMRYTEVRMAKIAHSILHDLEKETVDYAENYDGSESEPTVLPTRIPNLLTNGSSGIAVGMATNIPPHNLGEVISGCLALIDDSELSIEGLMEYIPAPDFPTGGFINGVSGIRDAYHTGRGRCHIRSKTDVEEHKTTGKQSIIVNELPYQVNKARLLEKIAELVRDKKIEGISGLRDESDKDGMRMVIELKRGEVAEVVLNNLFKQTQMQTVFGINMVAISNGRPQTLNLKQILEAFITHRREVVTRRTIFELRKARERAHLLEGQAVALANIDEVIRIIKTSPNPSEARVRLLAESWEASLVITMLEAAEAATRPEDLEPEYGIQDDGYRLSPTQAQAILDMKLQKLTGLEKDKVLGEYQELLEKIAELLRILRSTDRLLEVVKEELEDIRNEYQDARRTVILQNHVDLTLEDLITEEAMVVTLSHKGYVKRQALSEYSAQRRGGMGKSATNMKQEDFIDKLFIASTHDTLLCFTSLGRVYWLKVYELQEGSRAARGTPIINLIPLDIDNNEKIQAVLAVRDFPEDKYILMVTRTGTVKKTPLKAYSRPRSSGIVAVDLRDGDELVGVDITNGMQDIMIFTNTGKSIRFSESKVRTTGRNAIGVKGIKLLEDAYVISLVIADSGKVLTVTENGYGKCTMIDQYPQKGRGGQGVISIQTSERNGLVVGAVLVSEEDDVMLISDQGTLVRTRVSEISVTGRNTQGVRLIRLKKQEKLVGVEYIEAIEEEEGAADESSDEESAPDGE